MFSYCGTRITRLTVSHLGPYAPYRKKMLPPSQGIGITLLQLMIRILYLVQAIEYSLWKVNIFKIQTKIIIEILASVHLCVSGPHFIENIHTLG